jgi:N-methylhydantoinase A
MTLAGRYRVALDIGGTFTDVVAYDEQAGTFAVAKASTTDHDLVEGVVNALDLVVESPEDIGFLVHGTTQGLNALLQRRGERVLLLATEGLGDVFHIARGSRGSLYDLHYRKPTPLVPLSDIVEIGGRLDRTGTELSPLDEQGLRKAAGRVRDEGITAVAVAFLFSYLEPAHELAAERILRQEIGDDVAITLSHRIAREWREYERTSSAVTDAYIAPTVRRYLKRFVEQLRGRGLDVPVHIMQSSGGVATAAAARDYALSTLLSGPVGCTMGGVALAKQLARPNLVCVDMGGTSFDVSLVVDNEPEVVSETQLEGFPLLLPVVEIHTVGAGGGSIAYAEGGGLRVGPASAGAVPGPACYGRGGTRPTVTDANLVLGRLVPDWFSGGRLTLDRGLAEGAVSSLAEELGMSTVQMADGILEVVNATMAQAIRTLTVSRGISPRDFSLVAVGGAGALHAVYLARELDIAEVLVPPNAGTFSAWGMLSTDFRHDGSRPFLTTVDPDSLADLPQVLAEMSVEGSQMLDAQGVEESLRSVSYALDLRYVDQAYTLTVPLTGIEETRAPEFAEAVSQRFHDAHKRRFGHANIGALVECVTIRATAVGDIGGSLTAAAPAEVVRSVPDAVSTAEVVFDGVPMPTAIHHRDDLPSGAEVRGPAIVLEATTTNVIPPGAVLRVDGSGTLVINVREDS